MLKMAISHDYQIKEDIKTFKKEFMFVASTNILFNVSRLEGAACLPVITAKLLWKANM